MPPPTYQPYPSNNVLLNNQSDFEYYNSLEHYKPLCWSGKGSPLFFANKQWYMTLGFVMILNAIFVFTIVMFMRGESGNDVQKFIIINSVVIVVLNISYFLTQFLNPGLTNLATISQHQYQTDGKHYCSSCKGFRTDRMEHCEDCNSCMEGLDHHCGFFNKCIGGLQKYAFYCFLVCVGIGFFSLIFSISTNTSI